MSLGKRPASSNHLLPVFTVITVMLIGIIILNLPRELDFSAFPFCDAGANLSLQYLISHGYSPTVDFGYHYGLLPILVGRVWFDAVGLTPAAYEVLTRLCALIIIFAFAQLVCTFDADLVAIAIVLLTLQFSIPAIYPALAQALEAALLALALSQQAGGNRRMALILATIAVFAKPSMGYVYGALLITIWVLRTPSGSRKARFGREVAFPIAITAAICTLLLVGFYGLSAIINTVLPITGSSAYRTLNYGFFAGLGRRFWEPSYNSWVMYVFGPTGIWIAVTLFLCWAAAGAASRLWKGLGSQDGNASLRDELILTCFALHVTFIGFFFGNQWSWIYYSYIPVIGIVAAVDISPLARRAGMAVCAVAALSLFGTVHSSLYLWRTRERSAATAWMWSPPDTTAEWQAVTDLTRGHRTTILDTKGAAELMFPGFQPPTSLYLDPGLMLPEEVDRKVQEVEDSELIVVPLMANTCAGVPRAPQFHDVLRSFAPVFRGRYFDVYQRSSVASVPH